MGKYQVWAPCFRPNPTYMVELNGLGQNRVWALCFRPNPTYILLCFWASKQAQFVVIRPSDPVVHPPIKFTVKALLSTAIEMKLLFLLHMAAPAPAHSSSSNDRRHLGSLSCRLCHASSDTPGLVRECIDDEDEVFSFQTL